MNAIIRSYDDFIETLSEAGFAVGGGNPEGIYAVVPWGWNQDPPYDTPVRWHTGDPETDPWEWRMRVLDERSDIAYAKVFFKKSGFITRAWYPCFLAARRGGEPFADAYAAGKISHTAKRIYEVVGEQGALPLHAIKALSGLGDKSEKSAFDRALIELQMKMYLTLCGRQQKLSKKGEEYGWSSTVLCTVEQFWGDEVMREAAGMDREEAAGRISEQVYKLNPQADPKKVQKFIAG